MRNIHGYYFDYNIINLEKLKEKIKSTELLPSQKILLEKIDERFDLLESYGIKNLHDLEMTLKTKNKCGDFARKTGLPEEYLIVLRREVNSYQPKPRKLNEFECIAKEIIDKLSILDIKNTVKLFEFVAKRKNRLELAKDLSISNDDAMKLAKITDISRIRYVSPDFATLLINSKYDTTEKIQKADYNRLYEDLIEINKNKIYYKGNFGLKDMKIFINDANFSPLIIEY